MTTDPQDRDSPDTVRKWLKRYQDSTGFPDAWTMLTACPACERTSIEASFVKWLFPHWACDACKHVFVNPQPPSAALEELYRTGYARGFRDHVEAPQVFDSKQSPPFSLSQDMIDDIVRRVMTHRPIQRWLDFGGGLGWFANELRENHQVPQTAIREIDLEAAQMASDRFGVANVLEAGGRDWEVVSSIATLEHVPEPISFIAEMCSYCVPGGTIVISVPNFSRMSRLISKAASANATPPFHLSLFNRESLLETAHRSGCLDEIEVVEMGGPAFNPADIIDHSDHFDLSIPTKESPETKNIFSPPYSPEIGALANLLGLVAERTSDFFAEFDGRALLTLFARCR